MSVTDAYWTRTSCLPHQVLSVLSPLNADRRLTSFTASTLRLHCKVSISCFPSTASHSSTYFIRWSGQDFGARDNPSSLLPSAPGTPSATTFATATGCAPSNETRSGGNALGRRRTTMSIKGYPVAEFPVTAPAATGSSSPGCPWPSFADAVLRTSMPGGDGSLLGAGSPVALPADRHG